MRIGIFSEVYKPVVNGVVLSTEAFKQALERKGHEVFIFTSSHKDADRKEDRKENIFRCPSIPIRLGYGYSFPTFFSREAKKIMRSCDVFHAMHPFSICKYGLKIAKRHSIPIAFTNHTRYDLYAHYVPVIGGKVQIYLVRYVTHFAKQCDRVIVPSNNVRSILVHEYGIKNIITVPNGLPDYLYRGTKVKRKKNQIIYAGRLAEEKSVDVVLKAFEKVLRKKGHFTLVIAGEGEERERLEQLAINLGIRRNVRFIGFIPHNQISCYYRQSEFFVTASKTETYGMALAEAMASGCIPVVVDAPGNNDLVKNGFNGILVSDSSQSLADAILKLSASPKKRSVIRKNAMKSAEDLNINKTVKKLIGIYQSMIY